MDPPSSGTTIMLTEISLDNVEKPMDKTRAYISEDTILTGKKLYVVFMAMQVSV